MKKISDIKIHPGIFTSDKYTIWLTKRDGQNVLRLVCPQCGTRGECDDDQFNGKVSILCDCGFHETLNLAIMNWQQTGFLCGNFGK